MCCTTYRIAGVFVIFLTVLPNSIASRAEELRLTVPVTAQSSRIAVELPAEQGKIEGKVPVLVDCHDPEKVIAAQVVPAADANGLPDAQRQVLIAVLPPGPAGRDIASYRLAWRDTPEETGPFLFEDTSDTAITLSENGKAIYAYNHGTVLCDRVPESDGRRRRACYLHPIWGMEGEVLTDDFPTDHYHHHGIFWTWPHVRIGDKEYDLWVGVNLRHRFIRWLVRETGPVAAVLAFENGWFIGEEQVVTERIWVRSFASAPEDRSLDIAITCIPLKGPVTLWGAEGKSYGGLTMRFAKRKNTVITVPSGKTTEDLMETKLPWADFTAEFEGASGPSGAAILIPREHPAYPPTWLTRHYGVLCVGYPGPEPTTFTTEEPLQLDYRVWIHKGAASLDQLKDAYEGYLQSRNSKLETRTD